MDVATRTRLQLDSIELSSAFGFMLISSVSFMVQDKQCKKSDKD